MTSGCPKCAHREWYVSANMAYPMTLTSHQGDTGKVGFFGSKMERTSVRIVAHVCAKCAFTELYAKDLDVLAAFAQKRVGNVTMESC